MKTTRPTSDPEALAINRTANPVSKAITVGRMLRDVLNERFRGDEKLFYIWARRHLDLSSATIERWLALYDQRSKIPTGATRLVQAYRVVGLDVCPEPRSAA